MLFNNLKHVFNHNLIVYGILFWSKLTLLTNLYIDIVFNPEYMNVMDLMVWWCNAML